LEGADASVDELLGPGGIGAEVEGTNIAGAAAEQLQAEGGADEALPTRHREPQVLDPLVRAQMHLCSRPPVYRRSGTGEENKVESPTTTTRMGASLTI
jgi:hypothetical protein